MGDRLGTRGAVGILLVSTQILFSSFFNRNVFATTKYSFVPNNGRASFILFYVVYSSREYRLVVKILRNRLSFSQRKIRYN